MEFSLPIYLNILFIRTNPKSAGCGRLGDILLNPNKTTYIYLSHCEGDLEQEPD